MPDHVGKIIRIKNRFPGPPTLAVNTVGEGMRKHINLCFACRRFRPNEPEHCRIAQELFDFCNTKSNAGPIVRCAHFDPKDNVEVSNSGGYQ
jgi:hypothetical protein